MFIQENVSPLIEKKIPREGLLRKMSVLTTQNELNVFSLPNLQKSLNN